MAAYYWTTTDEEPDVYHNNTNCEKGKTILAANKATGDTPPAGRTLCKDC